MDAPLKLRFCLPLPLNINSTPSWTMGSLWTPHLTDRKDMTKRMRQNVKSLFLNGRNKLIAIASLIASGLS